MNKNFLTLSKISVMALIMTGLFACYPDETVTYSDLDIVVTAHDADFNFTNVKTYYLYDSVIHLKDTLNPENNVDLSRQFDQNILDMVRQNMANYGYLLESDPEGNAPDLIFTVKAMGTRNYFAYSYYPWYYWDWGWGWYYKSADYWYPYYPPYWGGTYITSYEVGTLIFGLYDVRNATAATDSIPVVWNADINGLLGSTAATLERRLEYGINQAFEQSPYLKTDN
jgi:hypothetical protein